MITFWLFYSLGGIICLGFAERIHEIAADEAKKNGDAPEAVPSGFESFGNSLVILLAWPYIVGRTVADLAGFGFVPDRPGGHR